MAPSEAGLADGLDELLNELRKLALDRDVILPVGGLMAAQRPDAAEAYLQAIERDQGRSWRRTTYEQARRAAAVADPARIYWQIGNEINSRQYAEVFGERARGGTARPRADASFVLTLYAERYFAPSVAGILAASREAFGDERRIRIALGSLAGAYRPSSRDWLDNLLSYRIRGDYAPELAGRQVFELVDVIAIHYLLTQGDPTWEATLSELRARWVGRGRISGVWATEELGLKLAQRELGGAAAMKAVSRCLDYALAHDLAPREFRCGLWGWWIGKTGTRGADAMRLLLEFLGSGPITRSNSIREIDADEALEWRAFATLSAPPRQVLIVAPKRPDGHGDLHSALFVPGGPNGEIRVTIHVFGPGEARSKSYFLPRSNSGRPHQLAEALSLQSGGAALILIEPRRPK